MNIDKLTSNIIIITLLLLIFFMSFTWIIFDFEKSPSALKDTWSIVSSIFGGITTLIAAYIASKLFNKWQDQHNKNIDAEFCMKTYDFIDFAILELVSISGFLSDYFILNDEEKHKYNDEVRSHARKLLNLKDISLIKLSNIAYFIEKEEYELKYAPQIAQIDQNLQVYLKIYQEFLQGSKYKIDAEHAIKDIDDLMMDTRNRYRAFIVELKKYYKA